MLRFPQDLKNQYIGSGNAWAEINQKFSKSILVPSEKALLHLSRRELES
jgi:hypothetical protein